MRGVDTRLQGVCPSNKDGREDAKLAQFWDRLGLRLNESSGADALAMGQISFSVEHPDLSSTTAPPRNALAAEFQAVTCSIDISTIGDIAASGRTPAKTGRQSSTMNSAHVAVQDEDFYQFLSVADQRAVSDFMSELNARPRTKRNGFPSPPGQTNEQTLDSSYLKPMIQAAIELLVLGGGRTFSGISVVESTSSQGLIQLLPAVFHVPYLKVTILPSPAISSRFCADRAISGRQFRIEFASCRLSRHA